MSLWSDVLIRLYSKYNKSKQELIVKALENEGLFDKAEVEESTLE